MCLLCHTYLTILFCFCEQSSSIFGVTLCTSIFPPDSTSKHNLFEWKLACSLLTQLSWWWFFLLIVLILLMCRCALIWNKLRHGQTHGVVGSGTYSPRTLPRRYAKATSIHFKGQPVIPPLLSIQTGYRLEKTSLSLTKGSRQKDASPEM